MEDRLLWRDNTPAAAVKLNAGVYIGTRGFLGRPGAAGAPAASGQTGRSLHRTPKAYLGFGGGLHLAVQQLVRKLQKNAEPKREAKMLVVHDKAVLKHAPDVEMHRGQTLSPFERPDRVESIVNELQKGSFMFMEPETAELKKLERVHAADYIAFLRTVYDEWTKLGVDGAIVPHVWPSRMMTADIPDSIFGRLGYYSFDAGTTIAAGTWDTVAASAGCSMTAATEAWQRKSTAFALCRPPGHHAERAAFGGYCFLNTAALAVEQFLHLGASKVAILDVDYHHGNGTQSIFYDRSDVLTISIHADPKIAYPYFCGYEHETGTAEATGMNRNFCLPDGTAWNQYESAIGAALKAIDDFAPDAIVIPFGADTFCNDPISTFGLQTDDFTLLGSALSQTNFPCAITMEGGYAIDALGRNVAAFLSGF